MVSKDEVKEFISKINPFAQKLSEIADKLSKLENDKEFQNLLGTLGTVGGLFGIGLYLFDKTLDHLSDTEKTYYSLINSTAISVAKKLIKEDLNTDEENNAEILEQMMKIYSFKETEKEKYQNWNGLVAYDHPIVREFRYSIIQILKENNLDSKYPNFITDFNFVFKDELQKNLKFLEYQKQKVRQRLSESRQSYFDWVSKNLGELETIDDKRPTDYYVQNRAIEIKTKDEINHKDYWNISDLESEEIFKDKRQWNIEAFLDSDDPFKLVAAPFGTGKTTFAKYITRNIVERNLLGLEENTWIPIYLPLKKKLDTEYKGATLHQILKRYIQPQNENVLLVCDGLDEYSSNPDDIKILRDTLLNIQDDLNSASVSIYDLKIIFTSRPEAGFPDQIGVEKYVRLLPFSPDQVTEFFKRYGHQELSFDDIKRYGLHENNISIDIRRFNFKGNNFSLFYDKFNTLYEVDLLKPLFCWMFALSYRNFEIIKDVDVEIARFILYSTFMHSILEGRYKGSPIEIIKEKWILRKIAALKSIFEEVYEEDLPQLLKEFIEKEQR